MPPASGSLGRPMMNGRVRAALVVGIAALGLLLLIATAAPGSAAPLAAQWSIFDRTDATSFHPGTGPATHGYEVVGFGAAGPSAALSTFVYGGADLTPPMAPIVTCALTVTPTALALTVNGAYPYAGCVYFVGVTNTGGGSIQVNLGSLDNNAAVTCNKPGCARTDLDLLAGATDAGTVNTLCRTIGAGAGGVSAMGGLTYDVAPGFTFVCPLFVTVLQPAKEDASYLVSITPPPLTPSTGEETLDVLPPPRSHGQPPSVLAAATPTATAPGQPPASPTPSGLATASPTPENSVLGVKTPGPGQPQPPATGSGTIVQRSSGHRTGPVFGALLLLAAALLLAWPSAKRRSARQEE